jgi:diguanylate cyclase (GGDEF)-like protein
MGFLTAGTLPAIGGAAIAGANEMQLGAAILAGGLLGAASYHAFAGRHFDELGRLQTGLVALARGEEAPPFEGRHCETRGINAAVDEMFARLTDRSERLRHQAYHDALTGLPNRAMFMARLGAAIDERRPGGGPLAVVLVDVDQFKQLNDTLGHLAGDEFLIAFAQRLLRVASDEQCLLARLGGDEFVMLVDTPRAETVSLSLAHRVMRTLDRPFSLADREVRVTSSIGIGLTRDGWARSAELLHAADIALYQVKDGGRAGHAIQVVQPAEAMPDTWTAA